MSLKHAILGFLSVAPMTGYTLRKNMDASVVHFWPADQTQIYRTLSKLVDDGLVDVQVIHQDGKPDQREHHILPEGLAELETWLTSPPAYVPAREAFLVRVFFSGRLPPEQIHRLLEERAAEAHKLLEVLRRVEQEMRTRLTGQQISLAQRLRLATLANGIIHAQAEVDWIADTHRHLRDQ
ncbi:PadR family transcriptional regulator [Deinococcus oregonensis]|uniref:PadR family transcriptional regulator n=1 Tax=Deinococcus oregonensis TaxID=1805970 RepID=A0ABV6ASN7_9DEIO